MSVISEHSDTKINEQEHYLKVGKNEQEHYLKVGKNVVTALLMKMLWY